MAINFNLTPYYDDYDPRKNYHRILFKPGKAVQARELTQLQTILQKQIEKFGKHIFKDGTIVLGGSYNIDTKVSYVKIKDYDIDGVLIDDVKGYIGHSFTGANTGAVATVFDASDGRDFTESPKTLFVGYTSSGTSGENSLFETNEVLQANVGMLVVSNTANSVGTSSIFTIQEGTLFVKDHFVNFPRLSIILDKYSNNPTLKVCFDVEEYIVDYSHDTTLLDPALGSNYSAPGADRYSIKLTLKTIGIDDEPDENTVELLVLRDGIIEKNYIRTQYSMLADEFAKRTSDESGDYYVRGLDIVVREHLDNGINLGYKTLEEGGNTNLLAVGVQPGKAYVKGYEVRTLVTNYLEVEKGLASETFNNQVVTARMGNYIRVNELTGAIDLSSPISVTFYDTPQSSLSDLKWSGVVPSGNIIGNAKINGITFSSGVKSSPTAEYFVYLTDIQMNPTKNFSSIKSIFAQTPTANICADTVLVSGSTVLEDSTLNSLLYYVGSPSVKNIKKADGTSDTTFKFNKTFNPQVTTGGTFNIVENILGQSFPFSEGVLSDAEKDTIMLTIGDNVSVSQTGTVTTTGTTTVNGTNTLFNKLNIGDKIYIGSTTAYIVKINSNTQLIVDRNIPSVTDSSYTKVYRKGDVVDLRTLGYTTGIERTVTCIGGNTLNFNLQETLSSLTDVTVSIGISKSSATEAKKILRRNRYVRISCATAGTTGPFNLGISDILAVKSIRMDSSEITTDDQGIDVTNSFEINNGQTDEFYGHGYIIPKGISLTSSTHLLIKLDYFSPDYSVGQGYFSVDSYPIDDNVYESDTYINTAQIPIFKSQKNGLSYDLRNYIDFRPVKINMSNDSHTIDGSSVNPTTTNSFVSGTRILYPASQIVFDYSSYLRRTDIICLDKNGNFSVTKGIPSVNPLTPSISPDLMALATIYISPYPSLSLSYASILKRFDLASYANKNANIRYTMRDIGILNQRIENLEYYSSLNLLEKDAADAIILDENGLDRFKNGIFADNFSNHTLGATYNPDYSIVVDPMEAVIRPLFDNESIPYKVNSLNGLVQRGSLLIRPYEEVKLLSQEYATNNRNVETSVFRFIGNINIIPPCDYWVDTQQNTERISQTIGKEALAGTTSTTYGDWQTKSSGAIYNIYDNKTNKLIATTMDATFAHTQAYMISHADLVKTNSVGWKSKRRTETRVEGNIGQSVSTRDVNQISYVKTLASTISDNKVTDVSLQTFIRPQILSFHAMGLKPSTRFYVFFDGEDMNQYAAQMEDGFTGTYENKFGLPLISNDDGEIYGVLQLPSSGKRFYTGTKLLRLTDNIKNNKDNETSHAEEFFVAQGLFVNKTNTILSTYQIVEYENNYTQTIVNPATREVKVYHETCMAYSFFVPGDPKEEGVFLTSVDLYFQQKHPLYGIWVELREMDSGGGITRTQIPYSRVNLTPDQINVSDDASAKTNIKFQCPIFLYNNTQYAFVIHTVGINDGYYYWIAKLGEKNISNNQHFNARKLTGTVFTTNNNLNWDIVPDTDLKITFYRAKFEVGSGSATLGNIPIDSFALTNNDYPFINYGEKILGGDRLKINVNGTVNVSDIIKSANASGSVIKIDGQTYFTSNNKFIPNEAITVHYANNVSKGITGTVVSKETPSGILRKYRKTKDGKYIVDISNSTGNFVEGDYIYGEISNDFGVISSIDDFKYSLIDFEPSYIQFNNTNLDFTSSIMDNHTLSMEDVRLNVEDNTTFLSEKVIKSASNDKNPTSNITAILETFTEYVSPIVDMNKCHSIYVENIINANNHGEANVSSGGSAWNKYISKIVTLSEGQDAEDIIIRLSAYKPATTDIKVYVKIRHNEDADYIGDKKWIEMVSEDSDVYSSISDVYNFFEISYNFPEDVLTGPNKEVQYKNQDGTIFTGYIQYQIKIVLLADTSAIVPKVGDLRIVNLQK